MKESEPYQILRQSGLRTPKILTIAITGACNLICPHCWVSAGAAYSAGHIPELTLLQIVDDYVGMGGLAIRFTGGEPLCYPDWLGILQYAADKGVQSIFLQTNGTLLTDSDAVALCALSGVEISVQVSLDGATAATHDRVRGAGSFSAALVGVERLQRAGLAERVTFFLTEMQHNLAEIPALLDLAAALGVGGVTSGTLVRCGRAGDEAGVCSPEPEQYMELLQRYADDCRFAELYDKIGTVAAIEWSRSQTSREECCSFAENPYITSDGHLYPCLLCHVDTFAVAGMFEKGLARALMEAAPLWTELMSISRIRSSVIPVCQDCPAKKLCGGGCMGRAWGSYGDLMSADDRCCLRRSIFQRHYTKSQSNDYVVGFVGSSSTY